MLVEETINKDPIENLLSENFENAGKLPIGSSYIGYSNKLLSCKIEWCYKDAFKHKDSFPYIFLN